MSRPHRDENPWRTAALVGTIGVDLAVCLVAGIWLGRWMQGVFGGVGWLVAGILCGLAAGIVSVILMIRKFTEGTHD